MTDQDTLPSHVETSIEALTQFHLEHHQNTSQRQRAIDFLTGLLSRPSALIILTLGIGVWVWIAATRGVTDHATFAWLELSVTIGALFVALLILVTQRHEDLLAERRAQLTLELALVADKKMAKLIALLEELRRDDPTLADRRDPESEEMAEPADPGAVLTELDKRAERGAAS